MMCLHEIRDRPGDSSQQTVIKGWERKWERTPLLMAQHCSDLLTLTPPELGK
jgi:hypothetical protein